MMNSLNSQGAKRDFLVLNFCNALLIIATEKADDLTDTSVKHRDSNKDYRVNKRIDTRLTNIKSLVATTIDNIYSNNDRALAVWIRDKTKTKIIKSLKKVETDLVNLEYLVLYLLFVNFDTSERKGAVLHESMKPITSMSGYILDTATLFEQTGVSELEGSMYDLAIEYIKTIKER